MSVCIYVCMYLGLYVRFVCMYVRLVCMHEHRRRGNGLGRAEENNSFVC